MINPFYTIPSLTSSAVKKQELDLRSLMSTKLERRVRREGDKVTYSYKIGGRPATRRQYCKELWDARRYSKWTGKIPPECRGRRRRKKKKKVKKAKEPENRFEKFRKALKNKGVVLPPEDKKSVSKSGKREKSEGGGCAEDNWHLWVVGAIALGALGVLWWLNRRGGGGKNDNPPPPPPVNPPSPAGRNSVMSSSVDASANRNVMSSILNLIGVNSSGVNARRLTSSMFFLFPSRCIS
jgi:hypothetical protein